MAIYDNKVPFSYFTGVREYDHEGNWKRNYLDLTIPLEELAEPRNDDEAKMLEERLNIELGENEEELWAYGSIPLKDRSENALERFLETSDMLTEDEKREIINENS